MHEQCMVISGLLSWPTSQNKHHRKTFFDFLDKVSKATTL